jgi:hypothetical protein
MYPEKPGTTGKIKKYDVLTGKSVMNTDGGPDVLRQPRR